jgi:amino acid adenylation domain-containing protein
MPAEDIEDIYELSPLQSGMLFHSLAAPEAALYFEQFAMPWPGPIDGAALTRAWNGVIERHAALRTSFHWEGLDKPLQVVHRSAAIDVSWHDWRHRSREDQEAAFDELLAADRARGFDLTAAPLMRLAVVAWSAVEHQLVISVHHIVMDGWSMQVAFRDFLELYQAACDGRERRLQPCRPYGDYIGWLQQQDAATAESFWRRSLAGFTQPTPLGVDNRAQRARMASGFEEHDLSLPAESTARLQAAAREHQLTLNTIVQGVWAILLSRYSGDTDVLFGTVVSGRPASLRGSDEMVGLFINTLAVPAHVASTRIVREFLGDLQAQQSAASQYAYSSLVDVQGWSSIPRGAPLFETLLVFENYPMLNRPAEGRPPDGARKARHIERTNLPLTLIVAPGERLSIKALSDVSRFESATVKRLLGHLETLLRGVVTHFEAPIAKLPLLTAAERRQVTADWNTTQRQHDGSERIEDLVFQQARLTPDAIAVAGDDRQLTYGEVVHKATMLAARLRACGTGRGARVAICLTRGPLLPVALLAVLKAGAAYLPLDPSHPRERLRTMLDAADVRATITETDLLATLETRGATLCVDAPEVMASTTGQIDWSDSGDGADCAYVIFTSGSTGKPKGVEVPHRGLVNFCHAMRELLPLTADDRVLAITTISFDIAVLELLFPLTIGARVDVASRDVAVDGVRLASELTTRRITALQATPASWRLLLDSGWSGKRDLHMLCGGEALSVDLARRLVPLGASLWNLYGPTETTVWSTAHRVAPTDADADAPSEYVALGRPIANTRLYVLGRDGDPVPVRVPGELHIGGAGVALGYLDDPDRTAERFVPDPYAADPGSRLYRTGDRVRYRDDGVLEFLGRFDHQVKIRGFRVEPGEVEAIVARHEHVRECAVIASGRDLLERRLVAYVVPEGESASPAELRRFVEDVLPPYMVPSTFVMLPRLPRTASGKIDRKGLPAPDHDSAARRFVAPRTDTERQLAAIVGEVLSVPRVGAEDDFFADLGGHSLLATQLVSRIAAAFGVDLPIRRLFDAPTIAGLAAAVDMLRLSAAPVAAGSAAYVEGEL